MGTIMKWKKKTNINTPCLFSMNKRCYSFQEIITFLGDHWVEWGLVSAASVGSFKLYGLYKENIVLKDKNNLEQKKEKREDEAHNIFKSSTHADRLFKQMQKPFNY